MQSSKQLQQSLRAIHKKGYPAYKSLRGEYQFKNYILSIDHVQGDPFASPSHISVRIARKDAGFPQFCYASRLTRVTLADYLTRQFERQVGKYTFQAKGSGKSGLILVSHCGQEVLERTACEVKEQSIIARFFVGFPANGRTINAIELEKILFDYLPICVENAFFYRNLNKKEVENAIFLAEDQNYIREELKKRKMIAFVGDGAILPRESGVSKRPMKNATPFSSPESLRIAMELPHRGKITGMGMKEGITLIVGGGYHGKSTLLTALDTGVYNHIMGDGREYVISDETALKLRSEDGRFIKDVDISLFINDLPNKKDTKSFSTEDASGSTSQAAGIVEGIEAGARVFLLDEDTSATNFMVRDAFMQEVIAREKEPITPFIERAGQLYEEAGISTILVAGSSGAFFHIAHTVIQMDNYVPVDITERVKELCEKYPLSDALCSSSSLYLSSSFKATSSPNLSLNFSSNSSLNASLLSYRPFLMPESHRIMTKAKSIKSFGEKARERKEEKVEQMEKRKSIEQRENRGERLKIKVHGKDGFSIGKKEVDLRYIEQLVDTEQTASLGMILKYALEQLVDEKKTISQIIEYIEKELEKKGLQFFAEGGHIPCGYAMPRVQEIYSCFNRYRR